MKDSHGTYDGRTAEPPYECPRCAELVVEVERLREAKNDLVIEHAKAVQYELEAQTMRPMLLEAEAALAALRAKLALWERILPATALAVIEAEAQRARREP